MGSSISRILFMAFLAGGAATAYAAHSKTFSVEPLEADFHIGPSGTIEASLHPPIQGVLRIIVQARGSAGRPRQGGLAGDPPAQNEHQPLILEVTQWDRPIPFRLVHQSGRHSLFGRRLPSLVADIDVNDLTPGVPVHVSVHANLPALSNSDATDLEARAYAVVY